MNFLLIIILYLIRMLPEKLIWLLSKGLGLGADYKLGVIARKAIQMCIPNKDKKVTDAIARQAAINSLYYIFSISRIDKLKYTVSNLDLITDQLENNKGAVIFSMHMGPPDLETYILQNNNIKVCTIIGSGKQKPWLNALGQFLLKKFRLEYIQRGDPIALIKKLKQGYIINVHCDMRSNETKVKFLGVDTCIPSSALNMALIKNWPIFLCQCRLDKKNNLWNYSFYPFQLITERSGINHGNKELLAINTQLLADWMTEQVCEAPKQWIWHYDRFSLKIK